MALTAALLLMSTGRAVSTRAGDLDPTFGSGGKVMTPLGSSDDEAFAVAIQPDGKIVAAGESFNGTNDDFALARYNPNGTLGSGFGSGGKVTTPIGSGGDSANALELQPDGRLVAAGRSDNGSNFDFALARYTADGRLDTSFNGTGKVTTPIGSGDDDAYALALQPDGKMVAAGRSDNGSSSDLALARYNADGSLDSSFGSDGKVTTAIGTDWGFAYAVALQPDGKIVAVGVSASYGAGYFALVRYNADGSLDPSFGSGGTVTLGFGGPGLAGAADVALQPDGKIVAAGWVATGYYAQPDSSDFALVRVNADGSLDASFGSGGMVTTAISEGHAGVSAVALQPDGKIVAVGRSYNGSNFAFSLARYNANGQLDSSFGSGDGIVTTPIGSGNDYAEAVALQPGGKIVAAGFRRKRSNDDFALARYLGKPLCIVPQVKGKKLAVAERAITKAQCRVGKVRTKAPKRIKRGRVMSQSPKAGTRLPIRGKINLVVSRGRHH